jgi:hypothetical protein
MYGLRVVAVPTHRPRARVDRPVRVYIQRAGKRRMLYALIQESTWRRQPMLIGTGSVADSEEISGWLHDWCARPAPPAARRARRRQWAATRLPGAPCSAGLPRTRKAGRGRRAQAWQYRHCRPHAVTWHAKGRQRGPRRLQEGRRG